MQQHPSFPSMLPYPINGGDRHPFGHRRRRPSPLPSTPSPPPSPIRTMEQVWRHIDLPTTSPPPATVPSLNSGGQDFHFLTDDHHDDEHSHGGHCFSGDRHLGPFGALAPSVLSSFGENIVHEGGNCAAPVDRRHRRMMKNRESAARSRARKQVYIHEMETENERLKQENKELRKQLESEKQMLLQAETANQLPTEKPPLQRASSAPF